LIILANGYAEFHIQDKRQVIFCI